MRGSLARSSRCSERPWRSLRRYALRLCLSAWGAFELDFKQARLRNQEAKEARPSFPCGPSQALADRSRGVAEGEALLGEQRQGLQVAKQELLQARRELQQRSRQLEAQQVALQQGLEEAEERREGLLERQLLASKREQSLLERETLVANREEEVTNLERSFREGMRQSTQEKGELEKEAEEEKAQMQAGWRKLGSCDA